MCYDKEKNGKESYNHGKMDEKIIAIPFDDPTYNNYRDISELPNHLFEEMRHFFSVYKELEGKTTAVDEVQGRETALKLIAEYIKKYRETYTR